MAYCTLTVKIQWKSYYKPSQFMLYLQ